MSTNVTAPKPKKAPPELLTVSEAAEYLNVHRKSLEEMIKKGTLRAVNVAITDSAKRKTYRLHRQDLDAFIRVRTNQNHQGQAA